jgi:hypothetical protein
MSGWGLFLLGPALAALGHNGLVEPVAEVFWELVNLVIAVDFDGFLGRIHHYMALVAPMQMFVQFNFQVLSDLAIEVIGQLF